MTDIPHLALPVEINPRGFAVTDQDSSSEVACCVQAIIAFPKGSRAERPDFGVDDPVFESLPLETGDLEADIRVWEPRAELTLEEETDLKDLGAVRLTINVTTMGA